ncbi:hypothetical protein [Caulobacter sp. LARHSG274]
MEIVLLTRAEDLALIRVHPTFAHLTELAKVTFSPIDDLMGAGAMPVTLTLAYQRGLRQAGERHGEVDAILLNADFILADGALASLGRTFDAGSRLVLAPSLRAVEELTAVKLARARVETRLAVAPRTLVRYAFDAPHPTVIASRADQGAVHSLNPNQLFWRAEPQTLVGRPFCLFVLAARIGANVPPAEAFCDYGLGPQLAPGVVPTIMNDSDAFFVLELAPSAYESDFVAVGSTTPAEIARRLSVWSMDFHRRQSGTPIFYRTGDPGAAAQIAVIRSKAFLDDVHSRLGPPQPVRNHPHWRGGLAIWRASRAERGIWDDPPELGGVRSDRPVCPSGGSGRLRRAMRRLLVGDDGRARLWHPNWALTASVRRRMAARAKTGSAILQIGARPTIAIPEAAASVNGETSAVFVRLDLDRREHFDPILERAHLAASAGTEISVICASPTGRLLRREDLVDILSRLESWADPIAVETFDLRADEVERHVHGAMADHFAGLSVGGKLATAARSAFGLARMFSLNGMRALGAIRARPDRATGFILDLTVRPPMPPTFDQSEPEQASFHLTLKAKA